MERILVPSGNREVYSPLNRELFWQSDEGNLYIYNKGTWVLIAGNAKQFLTEVGDNLEIVDSRVRLKDDVDVDSLSLGKFSNTYRWKGMVKLGEVLNSTFFPVVEYSPSTKDAIGGKFILKIYRDDIIEYGVYVATITAIAKGSIFGSSDQNVKSTLQKVTYKDGTTYIGFRTFSTVEKTLVNNRYVDSFIPPKKIEVWFNGWDTRKTTPGYFHPDSEMHTTKVVDRN